MQEEVKDIRITALGGGCGCEIIGVDLSQEQPESVIAAIRDAWNQHLVVVFRNQNITQEQQIRFASRFGALAHRARRETAVEKGGEETDQRLLLVSNKKVNGVPIGAFGDAEMWCHIDAGYKEKPYKYTFLYGMELPSRGGHTLFSNMYKAYEALPAALKEKLAGKKALHIHEYLRNQKFDLDKDLSGVQHAFHPVVVTHPETGRKSLFVDRLMTQRIEGVSPQESDDILEQLYEIGERPEFVYEHVWRLGDVVGWDNRCTIHARSWFPKEETRVLRRCTIEGEKLYE